MIKFILLCSLTFTSSIFASGMVQDPDDIFADGDGVSLAPFLLECFYHNTQLGIPNTKYESHTSLFFNSLPPCDRDLSALVSLGILSENQVLQEIAQDPNCFTHNIRVR